MKLRVLACTLAILAFFLFVGSPFEQAANAVAVVDDAIIAIIIAGLAAIGITFVTTGGYDTLNNYVIALFEEFAADQGTTSSNLLSGVRTGSNKLGQILVNNRFLLLLDTFARWLVAKFNLASNSNVILDSHANFGELQFHQLSTNFEYWLEATNGQQFQFGTHFDDFTNSEKQLGILLFVCNILYDPNNNGNRYARLFVITPYNGTYKLSQTSTPNKINTTPGNGASRSTFNYNFQNKTATWGNVTLYNERFYCGFVGDPFPVTDFGAVPGYASVPRFDLEYFAEHYGTMEDDSLTISAKSGVITFPTDDEDYTDGDGGIIDVGADWGLSYGDIIDDVIPDDFSDSKEGDATIEYEGEQEVQEQVDDSAANTVSQNVSDYQVNGLVSVFPFCIPFDLYNFVSCLAADPVAPSFTWRFYVPGICDESIEIDLSEFDAAAQILRTMELLLFCVGLAFVTRKIIRG